MLCHGLVGFLFGSVGFSSRGKVSYCWFWLGGVWCGRFGSWGKARRGLMRFGREVLIWQVRRV